MKSLIQPDMQYMPSHSRRTRSLRHLILILLGLFMAGLLIYFAPARPTPLQAEETNERLSRALLTVRTMQPLHALQNGDDGYITVDDIQSHPLLDVYIAPTVIVSRQPDDDRIVHLTIVDDVIVLDPISVQSAFRPVAMGTGPDTPPVWLSSSDWLQPTDSHAKASPPTAREGRAVTAQRMQE